MDYFADRLLLIGIPKYSLFWLVQELLLHHNQLLPILPIQTFNPSRNLSNIALRKFSSINKITETNVLILGYVSSQHTNASSREWLWSIRFFIRSIGWYRSWFCTGRRVCWVRNICRWSSRRGRRVAGGLWVGGLGGRWKRLWRVCGRSIGRVAASESSCRRVRIGWAI